MRLLVALVPGLLIVAGVLAFHARAAAPGMAFGSEDLREYFIPVRYLLQHTVRGGDWPFWQRSIYTGFPLWSSGEAALFLPTTWLYFAVEAARALTLGTLTHLVVAALGMFVWQRQRGRSVGAAMAAAFIVALGGFTTVHLDHWTFSATLAPLPWTLLAVDVAMRRGLSRASSSARPWASRGCGTAARRSSPTSPRSSWGATWASRCSARGGRPGRCCSSSPRACCSPRPSSSRAPSSVPTARAPEA